MPYKGLDALKAKITDPVIRKWADTLKAKSRTKLFTLLQFWDWASEVIAKDPKSSKPLLIRRRSSRLQERLFKLRLREACRFWIG